MYHIKNLKGSVEHGKTERLGEAVKMAEALCKEYGQNFEVIEVRQVWTTQTLDEVINSTSKGITCYKQDEKLCHDEMCLRTGCRFQ